MVFSSIVAMLETALGNTQTRHLHSAASQVRVNPVGFGLGYIHTIQRRGAAQSTQPGILQDKGTRNFDDEVWSKMSALIDERIVPDDDGVDDMTDVIDMVDGFGGL